MKSLFYLTFIFLLFSCAGEEKSVPPPPDLIPKEKMVLIMTDVNILEASLRLNLNREEKISDTILSYNIFRSHQISREQFESSMKYYSRDPVGMTVLMDEVIAELSRRQALVK